MMAPNYVWISIDAYWENQRADWERTRAIAWNIHIHAPYLKKKYSSIESFWPFPWESKEKQAGRFEQIRRYKEQLKKRNSIENAG